MNEHLHEKLPGIDNASWPASAANILDYFDLKRINMQQMPYLMPSYQFNDPMFYDDQVRDPFEGDVVMSYQIKMVMGDANNSDCDTAHFTATRT